MLKIIEKINKNFEILKISTPKEKLIENLSNFYLHGPSIPLTLLVYYTFLLSLFNIKSGGVVSFLSIMYLSIAIFFVLKNCIILLLPENVSFRNDSKKEITFLINEYKSDILKLVISNKELFNIEHYKNILYLIQEENYNDYFFNIMPIYTKKLIKLLQEEKVSDCVKSIENKYLVNTKKFKEISL